MPASCSAAAETDAVSPADHIRKILEPLLRSIAYDWGCSTHDLDALLVHELENILFDSYRRVTEGDELATSLWRLLDVIVVRHSLSREMLRSAYDAVLAVHRVAQDDRDTGQFPAFPKGVK